MIGPGSDNNVQQCCTFVMPFSQFLPLKADFWVYEQELEGVVLCFRKGARVRIGCTEDLKQSQLDPSSSNAFLIVGTCSSTHEQSYVPGTELVNESIGMNKLQAQSDEAQSSTSNNFN